MPINDSCISNKEITSISSIGEKRAKLYKRLGIVSVGDILTYYPRTYIDYNEIVPINAIEEGSSAVFKGVVLSKLQPYITSTYAIFKCVVSDYSAEIVCTFFNNKYAFDELVLDREYLFYGKVVINAYNTEVLSPLFITANSENKLVPVYSLTKGLSSKMVQNNVKTALGLFNEPDLLPQYIKDEFHLVEYKEALTYLHLPCNKNEYELGKKRLAFEELLTLQLGLGMLKNSNKKLHGVQMTEKGMDNFFNMLPFEMTKAQVRSIEECIADMQSECAMNRLLQGDVGSGKTLVAIAVCYFAYLNSSQSAVMVPTEILALQHYDTFTDYLKKLGVSVALITGSTPAKEKREIKEAIRNGTINVVIGTQALIQKDVIFQNLGLVIADEQHRFGVRQRSALLEKGINPHMLVMSATPIPRTLALIIYGDLDISVLDEMPKGRVPIRTYCVPKSYDERLYKFILKHVAEGRQAYIVCPVIEEELHEKASALKYYKELKDTYFKDITVGLLHGKMKQKEKDDVMLAFKNNNVQVLISTTVIEVGIDVPNAAIMIIQNAEHFGLSQLHQLRGRVGRGNYQSHCILVTDNKSEYTKARMDTMVETSDGFQIANADLKLRGPGDFFGSKQHGIPVLKIASMTEDLGLLRETQALAGKITKDDFNLSKEENCGLRKLVERLFSESEGYGFN